MVKNQIAISFINLGKRIKGKATILFAIVVASSLLAGFYDGSAQAVNHAKKINNLPQIIDVKTSPYPIIRNWVTLPKGPGKLKIDVVAKNATKVQFWLVPTGTDTWKYRKLIGEDTNGRDGWSMEWKYGDEFIHTHIVIVAVNPKGTSGRWIFNAGTEVK